ncbi:uncharacterized protein LOC129050860 isoform X6 [Pongo abelii]|uniref:uncharacterized protein LOC129050860 isoform X6 n=1 Tax=Pongo abelii TaxID=9601 RepID=UPI0023E88768|nr:uncharacterized protein LOC129050860 isoform X6 [Pongo abelii]XP_054390227.1 uncharacterized protein LOC129050860 isoform X6 [Pongo abelii]XP_054390228.1 uncharacterized protein LOC129050860 isoform X6 [Pongo abelii]XP_054390229.1 uncharacterized protein LOC129050860 isoform X6 [Pongo abelii]XP_054390230.1 uncharacterized protein LOC129050860 isoform X6 [Pongo abelii]
MRSLWAVPRSESEEKGLPQGSQRAGEQPPATASLPSPVLDICERMSGSPQASYPQTYSFTLKHQEIRTFWNLNMRGIGGEEGTEEESSPGQAGGKLKMAACPSWVAEVGAAGALADPGGLKSGSVLPSQEAETPEAEISLRPRRARVRRIPLVSSHQSQRQPQGLSGVVAAAPLPTSRSRSLSSFRQLQPGTKQGKAAPAQLDAPANGDLCTWL